MISALLVAVTGVLWIPDPLFDRMAGVWRGRGEKVRLRDRKALHMEIDVESFRKDEDTFVSQQRVREYFGQNLVRDYKSEYQLVARERDPGMYDLVYNTGANESVHPAFFADDRLEIVQRFPTQDGALEIESRTLFVGKNRTEYFETITHQGDRKSETRIRFERLPVP